MSHPTPHPMPDPTPDPMPDPTHSTHSGDANESSDEEEEDDLFALKDAIRQSSMAHKCKTGPKRGGKRSQKTLSCESCQPKRVFRKLKVLEDHVRAIHPHSPQLHVCLWCAKHFFTPRQLQVHQILYFHDKPVN